MAASTTGTPGYSLNPQAPAAPIEDIEKKDDSGSASPDPHCSIMEGQTTGKDAEQQKAEEGQAHFRRLGWKRLTVVLIVEAIALGSLSLPSAFATLGMVAGVLLTVGIGFIAIYTSHIVGQVKLKFPDVNHYADAGKLLMGKLSFAF